MLIDLTTDAWVETLGELECFRLLAHESVGRFAVTVPREGPLVVPVNYALDGTSLVFRSGYGDKLRLGLARPCSFQVDVLEHRRRSGWSVLARGRAHEVSARDVEHLVVEPWAAGGRRHWVRLDIRTISGRRIRRH
jgi:uncharacterized protein